MGEKKKSYMKIVFNQKNKSTTGKYTHCHVRADTGFLGSDADLAILIATSLVMFAGRQGLAPTANRPSTPRLQLENRFIAGLIFIELVLIPNIKKLVIKLLPF